METQFMRKKRDMFDYVGKGNTLYDILGEFVPELNEDYSTANLINKSIEVVKINAKIPTIELYQNIFDRISIAIVESIDATNNGEKAFFSEEQQNNLLTEIAELPVNQNINSKRTLRTYITDTRNNLNLPSTKPIRDLIITHGIDLIDETTQNYIRHILLSQVYIGSKIDSEIKAKYTIEEREDPRNEEWLEYKDLSYVFSNQNRTNRYNQYIKEYQYGIDQLTEIYNSRINEYTLRHRIVAKREESASQILLKSLSDTDKEIANKNGIINTILGEYSDEIPTPPQGTYEWKFDQKNEPEIVCDLETSYSEGGIENQRVIAISYGEITYNTNFSRKTNKPTYTSSGLELVGVTKIGNDGVKNYFVFTRFDNKTKIRNAQDYGVDTSNNSVKFFDTNTGDELFILHDDRIPEHQKEFYANAFFDDSYLSSIVDKYGRYAGYVYQDINTPIIMANEYDKKAVKYASKYRGKCGNDKFAIGELCKSKYLKDLQEGIVNSLLKQTKDEKNNARDISQGEQR